MLWIKNTGDLQGFRFPGSPKIDQPRHAQQEVQAGINLIDQSEVLMVQESLPCASDTTQTLAYEPGEAIPVAVAEMVAKSETSLAPPKPEPISQPEDQQPKDANKCPEKAEADDDKDVSREVPWNVSLWFLCLTYCS